MRFLLFISLALVSFNSPAGENKACSSKAHKIPIPLIGTWHEYSVLENGERFEGELKSYFSAGGCGFLQEFKSHDGNFTFRSLGYVDKSTSQWREHFVLSNGRSATYQWQIEGADILLNRQSKDSVNKYRLRLTQIKADFYHVIEERSSNSGKSWQQGQLTITRRVK